MGGWRAVNVLDTPAALATAPAARMAGALTAEIAVTGLATLAVLPMIAPSAGEPRLTLTLPILAAAACLVLHFEAEQIRQIPHVARGLPVHAVLAARPDPEIYWSP